MKNCSILHGRVFVMWVVVFFFKKRVLVVSEIVGERGGLVVNASDSGSRGRGFEPHSGQTVLCP